MATQDHVFNQYFLDFLKKVKGVAKTIKHESHDARTILRSIKKNYQNNDRLSTEFRAFMNADAVWDAYSSVADDDAALNAWIDAHHNCECLMKDVPLSALKTVLDNDLVLHHYFTVLNIFRKDMSEALIKQVIDALKKIGDSELCDKVEDDIVRTQLHRIAALQSRHAAKHSSGGNSPNMSELENTSLGKLAKEILSEVNVEELQNSFGNGDIMQALANPDGGLVKLLGTVSQKMLSKMSTGELKQESLLQDAMKLAGQIGAPNLSALGNIANMFGGGADSNGGSGGGFDFSDIAKMMGNLGGGSKQKMRPNTANIRRMAKTRELRQKLYDRQKTPKENISVHVEEEQ